MSHKPRTAEEVCIAYAEAVAEVRRLTAFLNNRANYCEYYEPAEKADYATNYPGYEGTSKNACVEEYESAMVEGDTGKASRLSVFEMCEACNKRLTAKQSRYIAREILYRSRRAVETVGKRLKGVQA